MLVSQDLSALKHTVPGVLGTYELHLWTEYDICGHLQMIFFAKIV